MYGNNGYGMNYMQYPPASGAMHDVLAQYKGPYQAPMPQQMPQMMPQSVPSTGNDMIWVQGEAGAKAYLLAPNATVVLWDTESPTIYVKTTDPSGKPIMRILDFKERGTEHQEAKEHNCTCGNEFVSKKEFSDLKTKIEYLEEAVSGLLPKEENNG